MYVCMFRFTQSSLLMWQQEWTPGIFLSPFLCSFWDKYISQNLDLAGLVSLAGHQALEVDPPVCHPGARITGTMSYCYFSWVITGTVSYRAFSWVWGSDQTRSSCLQDKNFTNLSPQLEQLVVGTLPCLLPLLVSFQTGFFFAALVPEICTEPADLQFKEVISVPLTVAGVNDFPSISQEMFIKGRLYNDLLRNE